MTHRFSHLEPLENRSLFSGLGDYGDADGNNVVDTADFVVLATHFNERQSAGDQPIPGDFNRDQTVNALDFNVLATNFGHRWMTERYVHIAFDNKTDTLIVGESEDAVHWEHYYQPNYTPLVGDVRDVSASYDPATQTWYIAHTSYNLEHHGSTFAIATSQDLQTFTPYMTVDCSAVIDPATQAPWAPQFLPSWYHPGQPRTFLSFMQSEDGSKNYVVSVDLHNKTVGSIVPIRPGLGSDPYIVPPDAPGNPYGKYIGLGGSGGMFVSTSDSLTGPYSFVTHLLPDGDEHNEAPLWLPQDDGSVFLYACGDHGTVYFRGAMTPQSGGSSKFVFGAEQMTTGDNLSNGGNFDVGQGDMVDRKALGTWP